MLIDDPCEPPLPAPGLTEFARAPRIKILLFGVDIWRPGYGLRELGSRCFAPSHGRLIGVHSGLIYEEAKKFEAPLVKICRAHCHFGRLKAFVLKRFFWLWLCGAVFAEMRARLYDAFDARRPQPSRTRDRVLALEALESVDPGM